MKRFIALLALLAASCIVPELAFAQPISALTRATSTTGLNDSTRWSGLDSASRVRAFSLAQIRKGLSVKAFDSLVTTTVNASAGVKALEFDLVSGSTFINLPSANTIGFNTNALQTLTIAGGNAATVTGGAGNFTLQCGTGASRTCTFQTTTSGSVAKNTLVLGADSSATFLGTVGTSSWSITPGGSFLSGATTSAIIIGNGTGGSIGFSAIGGDTIAWLHKVTRGPAGNMLIQAGTGASRTLTLATTTSGSAVKNVLVLGADSSATFLGAVSMAGGTLSGAAGTFSGVITSTLTSGVVFNAASATTGSISLTLMNSGNTTTLSLEDASGSTFGQTAYSTVLRTSSARSIVLMTNNSGRLEISSAGAFDFKSNAVSAITTLAASGAVTFSDATAAGAGDVYACKGTNNVFHYGAACAASTAKIKDNIAPYSGGRGAVMRLAPSSFSYAKGYYGQRADVGLIADAVAVVDPRFAFYAAADQTLMNGKVLKKGEAYAINWPAVTTSMLSELQDLQRQVDSLKVKKP